MLSNAGKRITLTAQNGSYLLICCTWIYISNDLVNFGFSVSECIEGYNCVRERGECGIVSNGIHEELDTRKKFLK